MMPPGFPQNVESFLMPPPKPVTSCLNINLVCRPALQLSILAIEFRFRTMKYASIGDSGKMFSQIKVKEEDQDFLRFL